MRILHVDDNPDDRALLLVALETVAPGTVVEEIDSVRTAVERLETRAARDPDALPDLVVLDLDVGAETGHDLLDAIRRSPRLCRLPITVLSGRLGTHDIVGSYARGARAFVGKPADLDGFLEVARALVRGPDSPPGGR